MMTYATFEEELNAIRLAIYEEIRYMAPEDRVTYFNMQAEPIIKEYGLQTINQIETETPKEAVLAQ